MITTKTYIGIRNAKEYHRQVHTYAIMNSLWLVILSILWMGAYYYLMESYMILPSTLLLPIFIFSSLCVLAFNLNIIRSKWKIAMTLFPRLCISSEAITLKRPLQKFVSTIPWEEVYSLTYAIAPQAQQTQDSMHQLIIKAKKSLHPPIECFLEQFVEPKEFFNILFSHLPPKVKITPSQKKILEMTAL